MNKPFSMFHVEQRSGVKNFRGNRIMVETVVLFFDSAMSIDKPSCNDRLEGRILYILWMVCLFRKKRCLLVVLISIL